MTPLERIEALTAEFKAISREIDQASVELTKARARTMTVNRLLLAAKREANPFPVGTVALLDDMGDHDPEYTGAPLVRVTRIQPNENRVVEYADGDTRLVNIADLSYTDRAWPTGRPLLNSVDPGFIGRAQAALDPK